MRQLAAILLSLLWCGYAFGQPAPIPQPPPYSSSNSLFQWDWVCEQKAPILGCDANVFGVYTYNNAIKSLTTVLATLPQRGHTNIPNLFHLDYYRNWFKP